MNKQVLFVRSESRQNVWKVVLSGNGILGYIEYHMNEFVFISSETSYCNFECLNIISEFIQIQNKLWRNKNDS
jgi:hypothetical protein